MQLLWSNLCPSENEYVLDSASRVYCSWAFLAHEPCGGKGDYILYVFDVIYATTDSLPGVKGKMFIV